MTDNVISVVNKVHGYTILIMQVQQQLKQERKRANEVEQRLTREKEQIQRDLQSRTETALQQVQQLKDQVSDVGDIVT